MGMACTWSAPTTIALSPWLKVISQKAEVRSAWRAEKSPTPYASIPEGASSASDPTRLISPSGLWPYSSGLLRICFG